MPLQPRMAFRCMAEPRHIHVPLFDPGAGTDDLLLVNFTTLRDTCVDDACILGPADYAELKHDSTIAYSLSKTGKQSLFCRAVAAGLFIRLEDLPEPAWQRILNGARNSPQLSSRQKKLLPP